MQKIADFIKILAARALLSLDRQKLEKFIDSPAFREKQKMKPFTRSQKSHATRKVEIASVSPSSHRQTQTGSM